MRLLAPLAAAALLLGCASDTLVSTDQITDLDAPRDIRYGALDGDAHPMVGLMVAQDVNRRPLWRCSGTLISPRVFLTAGHCTFGAAHVEIWFDADLESTIPGNGYPFTGQARGEPHAHPDYDDAAFYLADVGVVELEADVVTSHYAELPEENALEALATRRGLQERSFTTVGYGLQWVNPVFLEGKRTRMSATPHLVSMNSALTGSYSLLLSNNANTGGTCSGDSGGPNFIGSSLVVGGVTSFGLNGSCAGTGGVFRMDRKVARDWVLSFLP